MVVRRSELTTPGSSMEMIEKAAASDADEVMLNLENAVAPGEKVGDEYEISSNENIITPFLNPKGIQLGG